MLKRLAGMFLALNLENDPKQAIDLAFSSSWL